MHLILRISWLRRGIGPCSRHAYIWNSRQLYAGEIAVPEERLSEHILQTGPGLKVSAGGAPKGRDPRGTGNHRRKWAVDKEIPALYNLARRK